MLFSDGEFSLQLVVTFLAILISFLLSAVLIIITRTLSPAGWMGPGEMLLYDLVAETVLIAIKITETLLAYFLSYFEQ